jgi:hypothetical protein
MIVRSSFKLVSEAWRAFPFRSAQRKVSHSEILLESQCATALGELYVAQK